MLRRLLKCGEHRRGAPLHVTIHQTSTRRMDPSIRDTHSSNVSMNTAHSSVRWCRTKRLSQGGFTDGAVSSRAKPKAKASALATRSRTSGRSRSQRTPLAMGAAPSGDAAAGTSTLERDESNESLDNMMVRASGGGHKSRWRALPKKLKMVLKGSSGVAIENKVGIVPEGEIKQIADAPHTSLGPALQGHNRGGRDAASPADRRGDV